MNWVDITSLVDYFKFGYEGSTIDLIYLLLVGYLLFLFFKWFIQKIIKGVFK